MGPISCVNFGVYLVGPGVVTSWGSPKFLVVWETTFLKAFLPTPKVVKVEVFSGAWAAMLTSMVSCDVLL